MLMNESWELVHNGSDEVSIVGEANMDVIARHYSAMLVHAHVESSIDTVDFNASNGVGNIVSV